ncbi:AraC family transcriptional regulator [Streptomyces sp. IB2014 016-6]|uniref:AraC family transcriptional regulator n=1 Tax=Streptomyces sp. IB2014 016-6 TaxID=2517818 RepID=UPI0011C75D47|nr:AraC family transcriptional regulator [Streptomyces sp. IB2014 016-6]TXL86500.1 AraC family transcriptional regulator [Streptomyces sp. IB2014 016-6]
MDVLTDLLDGVRARGAVFSRTVMTAPWSLRFASGAPLTLATVLRGQAWLVPAEGDAVRVRAGHIALVRGSAPYTVADAPDTPPRVLIDRADYCGLSDPAVVPDGGTVLLSGAYDNPGGVSERLLRALPPVLVIPDADCHSPMLALVTAELTRESPGQQAVLDRLLDLLLISALRGWFDRPGTSAPPWYLAADDPVVGQALRLLHDRPADPWTVAKLAAGAGVSRAALARRFTARIGEPPMTYLTGWRISLAADLLRGTDDTVGAIARKVGYANTFALSVAFKRLRRITPSEHRAAVTGTRRASTGRQ